jgi:hypothetical protein
MPTDTLKITLSPATAYATSSNIVFPGTETQAEAAEVAAEARVDDAIPSLAATVDVKDIPIG